MPWIEGAGSMVKPLDDSTKVIQELEPTGAAKETVKVARGIVDVLTETVTPIRLKQALKGYQIAISDNNEIKKIGPGLYLLYLLPILGIALAFLSSVTEGKKMFNFLTFFIAFGIFVALSLQVSAINREGLFVKIQSCPGYWLTLYSFLGISLLVLVKILISFQAPKNSIISR